MAEKREYNLLGRQFHRKDAIARVTGRERYTCVDGGSLSCKVDRCGSVACENIEDALDVRYVVACRNSLYVRIPVNEVV